MHRSPLTAVLLGLGALAAAGRAELPARVASAPRLSEGVVGRVTNASGAPITGAFVQARSLDEPAPPIPEIAILTDEDGRYAWPLEPGRYELTVSADGYRPGRKRVAFKKNAVAVLDFVLERKT